MWHENKLGDPSFYYLFNISFSCNNSIPSFIGNLWRGLLLGDKVAECSFSPSLTDTMRRVQRDCKNPTCRRFSNHFVCSTLALSVLFFFIIERSVLIAKTRQKKYRSKNPATLRFFFVTETTQLNGYW